MKKILIAFAGAALVSSQLFAYWVVLKDGTRYETTGKPVVAGAKATFSLKNGQLIQVPTDAIDNAKSEEVTKLNGAIVIGLDQPRPAPAPKQQSSLGSQIRLRRQQQTQQAAPLPVAPVSTAPPALGADVVDKFERAYENVGIFEHKMTATGGRTLRADLTTDSEEKVFNAISATALLIVRNAGIAGVTIDEVDMYMKMTNGGTAGRFHMTRADADGLYAGGTSPDRNRLQEYFVHKVLF